MNENLARAHRRAYDVLKAGPGRLPGRPHRLDGRLVEPEGGEATPRTGSARCTRQFLEAARGDDFIGVQAYSRTRIGLDGLLGPEDGVEVVPSMGYEYWPQSLEVAIRHATETGRRRCTSPRTASATTTTPAGSTS